LPTLSSRLKEGNLTRPLHAFKRVAFPHFFGYKGAIEADAAGISAFVVWKNRRTSSDWQLRLGGGCEPKVMGGCFHGKVD
jgi:hypothetical protein